MKNRTLLNCLMPLACTVVSMASFLAQCSHAQLEKNLEAWQSLRGQLRSIIAPLERPEYEIRMLARHTATEPAEQMEKFEMAHLPPRIILVISGLQGRSDGSENFAKALEEAMQFPKDARMAVFDYPNDGSIRESGNALRQLLEQIHIQSPKTTVSIVAHSMGGLVSRWAIEQPAAGKADSGTGAVDKLIMICPPNQGSVLAKYADVLEIADAMSKLQKGKESFPSIIYALIDDGLGEASDELIPGSDFIKDLNALERVPGIRYSIFAGTRGPISPLVRTLGSLAVGEGRNKAKANRRQVADEALKKVEELLNSDELSAGLGDGAVSLRSARLNGVTEFVKLPIHHAEWSNLAEPNVQDLINRVAGTIAKR